MPHDPSGDAREAAARRRSIEELLFTLDDERHYLVREGGVLTNRALLGRLDLTPADIAARDVQARLEKFAARQASELALIDTYVAGAPGHLFFRHGAWQLDDEAPREVQKLVAAWANDKAVQRALKHLSNRAPPSPATSNEPVVRARRRQISAPTIGGDRTASRRATLALVAEQREASTERWIAARRTDAPPGAKEPATERTAPSRAGVTRHASGQAAGNDGQDR